MVSQPLATTCDTGSLWLLRPDDLRGRRLGVCLLKGHISPGNARWHDFVPTWMRSPFSPAINITSRDWYPGKIEHGKEVPTWNYAVVHAYGPQGDRDEAVALDVPEPSEPTFMKRRRRSMEGERCASGFYSNALARDSRTGIAHPAPRRQMEGEPEPNRGRTQRRDRGTAKLDTNESRAMKALVEEAQKPRSR